MLLLLQGCFFTGVESTPKVTASDVRREREPVTAEDTFLAHVADEPLGEWRPGKRFTVTDPRISLIFGSTASGMNPAEGSVITYAGMMEASSPMGTGVTDLMFRGQDGTELVYRINRPADDLLAARSLSIPFTIQESVVSAAAAAMEGKDYYILTLPWRDDRDEPMDGGRKFVRVHVDSVTAGNAHYPLKASFRDEQGLSGRIFFHPGGKGAAPRTFPTIFSFNDPRKRYQSTSPEFWELITRGAIAEGMTREECRLALGAPKEVERGATQSYLREAWLYENGVYLLFEDGLLKRFRI